MRLLLVGEHYSNNLGDGVISDCFIKTVSNFGIEYCKLDLSGREQRREFLSLNNSENRLKNLVYCFFPKCIIRFAQRLKRAIRVLKMTKKPSGYDAVVYIGGSIFKDYFIWTILFLNLYQMLLS